jgi:hypothetical protein
MGTKRRTVLSGSLLLGGGALLNAATTACSSGGRAPQGTQASAGTWPTGSSSLRVLLAYFSRAGENYWYGGTRDLAVGNTQVVAEMIASLVRVDVYRIQAADPYPQNYRATVDRNVAEQNADARPAIAGTLPDTRLVAGQPTEYLRTVVAGKSDQQESQLELRLATLVERCASRRPA